jgi:glycosyltransferase involved in cell wall biosynthesis
VSISQIIRTNKYIRKIKKISEYIARYGQIFSQYKIFFPYRSDLTHPLFLELKNNPPLNYVNKKNANLFHLVMGGSKRDLEQNHIVEIFDHAFSMIASYEMFPREPIEYYNRQEKIKALYLSDKLKKLIFISNGQRELFKYYFNDKVILDKSIVIPISWANNINLGKKIITKNINFLFIASNYNAKGVQIVLKSWNKFQSFNNNATLTLVSHDIPIEIEKNLGKNIKLVKEAPLNSEVKFFLFKGADVVLAFALTDSIIAVEATSYGKPVVTFRSQHSKDFINNDNGMEIDVPINMYDVDKYGILWKTKQEFDEIVQEYISNGKFDRVVDNLVEIFVRYSEDPELLKEQTENAIEKYYRDYTAENRNKKLMEVYDECE